MKSIHSWPGGQLLWLSANSGDTILDTQEVSVRKSNPLKHTATDIYTEVSSSLLTRFCLFIQNNKRLNPRAVSSQSDTIATEQYLDKQQAHIT